MAISRKIENEEAATIFLLQLAFENDNAACQKALFSVRNEHANLPAYIKACLFWVLPYPKSLIHIRKLMFWCLVF